MVWEKTSTKKIKSYFRKIQIKLPTNLNEDRPEYCNFIKHVSLLLYLTEQKYVQGQDNKLELNEEICII